MSVFWAVILAAGKSVRLGEGTKKQFLVWKKRPLFWHSVLTFSKIPKIKGIVLVFPKELLDSLRKEVKALQEKDSIFLPIKLVGGGERRQDSSFLGICELPKECSHVLIHDAARPFVSASLIRKIIDLLENGHKAVVPGIKPKDTIRQIDKDKTITLPRENLFLVQTPQGFELSTIKRAYEQAGSIEATDDAYLVEVMGEKITLIEGEEKNLKITTKEDLKYLKEQRKKRLCIGFGYDVHRFGIGKPLKLGGVKISSDVQVIAHSDGDVLLHALVDAILGAISHGDIGDHFPDSDPSYKDMSSAVFLSEVLDMALKEGLVIEHVDITIITQTPKISPYKEKIKRNLANLLNINPAQINVKATTEEGLGFTGEKKGIKCFAQVIGYKEEIEG